MGLLCVSGSGDSFNVFPLDSVLHHSEFKSSRGLTWWLTVMAWWRNSVLTCCLMRDGQLKLASNHHCSYLSVLRRWRMESAKSQDRAHHPPWSDLWEDIVTFLMPFLWQGSVLTTEDCQCIYQMLQPKSIINLSIKFIIPIYSPVLMWLLHINYVWAIFSLITGVSTLLIYKRLYKLSTVSYKQVIDIFFSAQHGLFEYVCIDITWHNKNS